LRREKQDLFAQPPPGFDVDFLGPPPPEAETYEPAPPASRAAGADPGVPVEELAQVVIDGMREAPIARETLALLQVGLPYLTERDYSDDAVIAGQTAARLGYLSRAAEYAMFDGLDADEGLVEALGDGFEAAEASGASTWDAMAELAAAMAVTESLDPRPGEDGPSTTLPGLGAHYRTGLRNNMVGRLKSPPDVRIDDLKRTWKYGYFLRVLDELCDE